MSQRDAARLVLGPLLRYTGTTTATVWIETDGPATVRVLGHEARSFQVEGHHYALVEIADLEPGTVTPYEVELDGTAVWPPDDGRPPSAIRTRQFERVSRLAFGSCRVGAPQRAPYTSTPTEIGPGVGIDALWAYSRLLQSGARPWPDALLLLGDQVYADEVPPETAAFIRSRRDVSQPPGEEIADFEEYTRLYQEAWSDPDIRWLLSTVPSTMIFDDHDVNDDWNISRSWVDEMRVRPWWDDRITGAFMAYWLYQHLGNLSPPELAEEEMWRLVRADTDAGPRLREFARRCDRESASSRWAFYRDFGRSRLIVIDSRAARVLTEGRRAMVDAGEWDWIVDHCRGDFDHLVIASTLPVFMLHGIHHLEALNEVICDGAWGRWAARAGELLRRAVDLEHWPAFHDSLDRLVDLLRHIGDGELGAAPATITLLGGDVHTVYAAGVDILRARGATRVHQIVCSPLRNSLSPLQRGGIRLAASGLVAAILSTLARWSGVAPVEATWSVLSGPTFENAIGELELNERAASATISCSSVDASGGAQLAIRHALTL
jgi:PhoD-like phosphatase